MTLLLLLLGCNYGPIWQLLLWASQSLPGVDFVKTGDGNVNDIDGAGDAGGTLRTPSPSLPLPLILPHLYVVVVVVVVVVADVVVIVKAAQDQFVVDVVVEEENFYYAADVNFVIVVVVVVVVVVAAAAAAAAVVFHSH
ncbi:hypothetical protein GQX74_001627 [Glossina fuscipes]|nr:hypothetical protein GQX74_001627 [Glossina fuscipes]